MSNLWNVGRKWVVAMAGVLASLAGPGFTQTISPRRLLEVSDFSSPVISPNGMAVAFRLEQASVERNTYDTVWYVQSLDGGAPPHPIADGGIPLRDSAGISLPAPAIWSPDGRWIYYRALVDGKIEVWRAATDGSGAEPTTLDPADVRQFSLSENGGALRYSVGATRDEVIEAEQAEYDRGIRVDERVPVGQGLFRSGYIKGRLATQRFAKVWFDREALLDDLPDRWKELELATGKIRDIDSSKVASESPSVPSLSAGQDTPWLVAADTRSARVAVLTRIGTKGGLRDRPNVQLTMRPNARAGESVTCHTELCTGKAITSIQWRPGTDEVLFTVTDPDEGLAQSVYGWNVESGEVRTIARSAGLLNGGRDPSTACGLSTRALVCVAAEANVPPRLERIDLQTGERRVLFDPNAALAVDVAAAVPARLIHWTDARGKQFTGQFFSARRPGKPPVPLFVTYYTCPGFLRGGLGDEWPLATLAEEGISALCINRLPEFALDAVERHEQGMAAVEGAIDSLASEGEIDRSKVGMGGLSFGGAVTMWTVTDSRVLKAASVSSAIVSPLYYLIASLKGRVFIDGLREGWQLGAPNETPDRWRAISPALKLDRVSAPVLFQMPEQEYMSSLDYLVPLIREHRADLYVFPNEPHQKFQPKHKLAVYERNLDWFRFWLQGYEDQDPSKGKQYMHWRVMRDHLKARP